MCTSLGQWQLIVLHEKPKITREWSSHIFTYLSQNMFFDIMPMSGNQCCSDFQGNRHFTRSRIKLTSEGNYWLREEKSFKVTQVSPKILLLLLSNVIWRCTEVKVHVCKNTASWTCKKYWPWGMALAP